MSFATIIDGKKIAREMRSTLASQVSDFRTKEGYPPGLAVVLVGDDPASEIYVRNKVRQATEVGILSRERRMPSDISESALLSVIDELNANQAVHGILVQLPLPAHISAHLVLRKIRADKDVDGFHPENVGGLVVGLNTLVPCTPLGISYLIKSVRPDLAGARAVVLGRSNIVGKPVSHLLLAADATVTVAHSRTLDVRDVCRQADILVAAVGRPEFVRGDWIKKGAIVIDVGINRVDSGDKKLVGDVAYEEALPVAAAITPVPGGVGPMTIACLLENTLKAARARHQM